MRLIERNEEAQELWHGKSFFYFPLSNKKILATQHTLRTRNTPCCFVKYKLDWQAIILSQYVFGLLHMLTLRYISKVKFMVALLVGVC